MKKYWVIFVAVLLLSGCSNQTMETVDDVYDIPVSAVLQQLSVSLPEDAAAPTMVADDGSQLYLCDGYTVTLQTLEAGDLEKTFRTLTGFAKDDLTVMQTQKNGMYCYECVWSTAGEGEDQLCRAKILDDGDYHYAVTVMADYTQAGELSATWQHILDSMHLVSTD